MPYISKCRRRALWLESSVDFDSEEQNPGELNYRITCFVLDYVYMKGISYQVCNDIVGCLENVKHEFQRRIQDPYENLKIKENGDLGEYKDAIKKIHEKKK